MQGAAVFGGMILTLAAMALIALVIEAVFIWIGARLAGVYPVTFGRCFKVAFFTVVITFLAAMALHLLLVLHILPMLGPVAGWIIGVLISIYVIKAVFAVGFGRALVVWIFTVIAQVIAVLLVAAYLSLGGINPA